VGILCCPATGLKSNWKSRLMAEISNGLLSMRRECRGVIDAGSPPSDGYRKGARNPARASCN